MRLEERHRLLVEYEEVGGHTHVTVRMGTALVTYDDEGEEVESIGGTRANAGSLVFRNEEWPAVLAVLQAGGLAAVLERDADAPFEPVFEVIAAYQPSERAQLLGSATPYNEPAEASIVVEFRDVNEPETP